MKGLTGMGNETLGHTHGSTFPCFVKSGANFDVSAIPGYTAYWVLDLSYRFSPGDPHLYGLLNWKHIYCIIIFREVNLMEERHNHV